MLSASFTPKGLKSGVRYAGSTQELLRDSLTYNAMEFRGFVAHRSTLGILVFPRTELAEVLSSFWDSVAEELHFDTAKWFS